MPKFQKEFPRNAIDYFDPSSDDAFKKAHPIKYGVLVICAIAALILPLVILLLLTEIWFPAPDSGFLLLAMAGAFIIGIGFFNIVSAWFGQYLGHLVTVGCISLGFILTAIPLAIIYIPDIYALFDEQLVTFYFVSILFFLVPPMFYLSFRLAVDSWLKRKGISKKRVKILKTGKKNYWWYEALHEEVNLGLLYYTNKIVTVLYPSAFVLALTLGWLRFMAPIISVLYVTNSVLLAGMSLFSSVQENIDEYGTPIVIMRKRKNNGYDSSLFDILMAAFPLMAAYAHILLMFDALGIPR